MQRLPFLVMLVAWLVTGCAATATPLSPAQATRSAPPSRGSEPTPPSAQTHAYPFSPAPMPGTTPAGARALQARPKVALLLPLQSKTFGLAANLVEQGFLAAYTQDTGAAFVAGRSPVRVYPTDADVSHILAAYQQAVQDGNEVIVGPLTRDAVTALAASGQVTVPTLALNVADRDASPNAPLYCFSLSTDAEARAVARLAYAPNRREAAIISSGQPLARRAAAAFAQSWTAAGGRIAARYRPASSPGALVALGRAIAQSPPDVIFLADGLGRAQLVRPYLPVSARIYATSQINSGQAETTEDFNLEGVRFVDMPWLLQPNAPSVTIYPRPANAQTADQERLYALGIDAYRLAQMLASGSPTELHLAGVTGDITLRGHRVVRHLLQAQFQQGQAVVLGTPAP
ncbi:MAG: penicillin-binding protein activator [Betaproteobacteria bacterium]|nr:penicillin-binding protein activator [Betaproteobacteria bacterium]